MTKKTVAELSGIHLDYMVAKAIGLFEQYPQMEKKERFLKSWMAENPILLCQFAGNWLHAGVLIEKYKPKMEWQTTLKYWVAVVYEPMMVIGTGETFQLALCRAIVKAHFGERVEMPVIFEFPA